MAASISQQLEELLNPLPTFADPEDDQEEETKARVIDKFDEGDDDDLPSGVLRKRGTTLLADTDKRYRGKPTSRKEMHEEMEDSADEEDDEDDAETADIDEEDDDDDEEDDEEEEDGDDDDDDDDEVEGEDLNDEESAQMSTLVSKMKSTDLTFPKETDFLKLTQGMDDLGESEEEEEGDTDDGESEEDEEEEEEDESGAVMTFSKEKVDGEVEKGKAVKNQLALWDLLLEGRIKLQKALVIANQLPQPDTCPEFRMKGGAEYAGALKNSHKALKALQRSLLELQDLLLFQNPDTRAISEGKTWGSNSKAEDDDEDDDEVISDEDVIEVDRDEQRPTGRSGPPKRKLDMTDYSDFMAKRFAAFQPYRNATLQKWYDKTRLTMGKTNKGFGAFERNILTQVDQVLMDKERLLRRTQIRRSDYRVLGKPEPTDPNYHSTTDPEATDLPVKANTHLKDLDEEIFDDDDFYHQLLRELIERKTSAADPNDQVATGKQWLAIQKLRRKIKKKVDTKASKGRKVRFHIHSKLVNFMAPVDHSAMSDEARSELYRSLFGSQTVH